MTKKFNLLFLIFTCFLFTACGADKLKASMSTTSRTALTNGEVACSCASIHSPVCGLSDHKDYDNACIAQCFGQATKPGHCFCSSNNIPVCGSDGHDYSECDAVANHVDIVKYAPCGSVEI